MSTCAHKLRRIDNVGYIVCKETYTVQNYTKLEVSPLCNTLVCAINFLKSVWEKKGLTEEKSVNSYDDERNEQKCAEVASEATNHELRLTAAIVLWCHAKIVNFKQCYNNAKSYVLEK